MSEQARARLLIVHPESGIQRALEQRLRRHGYDVATAANGEEALGWLMQREFDLVVVEPMLPGMDGFELAQCAQRCQPEAKIVLFIGANDTTNTPTKLTNVDYLRRTINPTEVVYLIAARLALQQKLQPAA